jgi:hypothetical protein
MRLTAQKKESIEMKEILKESLASATGTHIEGGAAPEADRDSNRVVFSVVGPGFSDREEF